MKFASVKAYKVTLTFTSIFDQINNDTVIKKNDSQQMNLGSKLLAVKYIKEIY